MESMEVRINKLREERIAREKARIEKLRDLNLKKYNNNEPQLKNAPSNSAINKPTKNDKYGFVKKMSMFKNSLHDNRNSKNPITVPIVKKSTSTIDSKPKMNALQTKVTNNKLEKGKPDTKIEKPPNATTSKTVNNKTEIKAKVDPKLARKSLAVPKIAGTKPTTVNGKSMLPKPTQTSSETVFDRLYKPKTMAKEHLDSVKKLQTDPNYLKKVIKNSGLILNNKRHTLFDARQKPEVPVRRSISAVHFKRISKSEIQNCIHKWSSIGDKMDNVHLKDINEDEHIKEDKFVSAVKSDRKRVTFMTPVPQNYNTPRPEELQARLKNWLQKRGKSLDSYHHLQCFGITHLIPRDLRVDFEAIKYDNDENKENIAVESDSDDGSISELNGKEDVVGMWRRASNISESMLNETTDTTATTESENVNELVLGALNDLTELLKEGFEWEQCARWLRAIRERFPTASNTAAYWECRAALEETRGDLPASVQCWEEAIAKGTEHSVVEANLDHLLDKFMQLKISPNSGKRRQVDPKMVDVKNVFKSTIIRFAVQQAKLRQSTSSPKFIATPVRRSNRLTTHRTPLRLCSSVKQMRETYGPDVAFVPNDTLCGTP